MYLGGLFPYPFVHMPKKKKPKKGPPKVFC